ncbi:MAG: hypothetical protein L0177_00705 [Chloroflexi bacterium]|nr:hypothetical protein [Chloroflexota bacterium]
MGPDTEMELGKELVLRELFKVASECSVRVEGVRWLENDPEGSRHFKWGLEFYVSGRRVLFDVSFEDLQDCVNDPVVRAKILRQLVALVQSDAKCP